MKEKCDADKMEKKIQNVISYRVYEISEDSCLVEVSVMKYEDEWRFYQEARTVYPIQTNTYKKNIDDFNRQMQEKCNIHGYDFPLNSSLEEKNAFLAEHYFVNIRKYDESIAAALDRLNERAIEFQADYNTRYFGDERNISAEESKNSMLLEQAVMKIGNGISTIECMNVGQGNFSIGYDAQKDPRAVFDIGIPAQCKTFLKNKISKLQKDGIVVISHYDSDHIRGFKLLPVSVKERIWILPERRKSPTITERNFLEWLGDDHGIFLKNINYAKVKFDIRKHTVQIGNIRIFQGNEKKRDNNQSTDENARSLICQISGKKKALLPADTLYKEFPTGFSKVNYLVVPHHCCEYKGSISNNELDLGKIEKVVVFAGKNNRYHHPNITHLQCLGCTRPDKVEYLLKTPGLFDGKNTVTWKMPSCPDSYKIDLY